MPLRNRAGSPPAATGLQINGNLVTYTVGTGVSISSGDFVEYIPGTTTIRPYKYVKDVTSTILGVARDSGSAGSRVSVYTPK